MPKNISIDGPKFQVYEGDTIKLRCSVGPSYPGHTIIIVINNTHNCVKD